MKNEVRDDAELRAAFTSEDTAEILAALQASERGRRFIAKRVEPYQREFGWHAVWSQSSSIPTVREDMEPVLELVRGYLATTTTPRAPSRRCAWISRPHRARSSKA